MEENGAGKVALTPVWLSRDMDQAEPPVVAERAWCSPTAAARTPRRPTRRPGLGFNSAVNRIAHSTHATLYALDAQTGKELWSSGEQITSFNHFSGLSVANGRVYIGTYDGMLYCFAVGQAKRRQCGRARGSLGGGRWGRKQRSDPAEAPVNANRSGSWSPRRSAAAAARRCRPRPASGRPPTAMRSGIRGCARDPRLTKDAVQKGELKFLWKMKLNGETRQLNALTQPILLDRLISHRGFKALAFVGTAASGSSRSTRISTASTGST